MAADDEEFSHLDDDRNYSISMQLDPQIHDDIRYFLKEGFLQRLEPGLLAGSWRKQYVRLTEHALTHHEHPNAEAKGVALIVDITGVSFFPCCFAARLRCS